jgi:hypothetical protein
MRCQRRAKARGAEAIFSVRRGHRQADGFLHAPAGAIGPGTTALERCRAAGADKLAQRQDASWNHRGIIGRHRRQDQSCRGDFIAADGSSLQRRFRDIFFHGAGNMEAAARNPYDKGPVLVAAEGLV